MVSLNSVLRVVIVLVVGAIAAIAGVAIFVQFPTTMVELVGIVLALGITVLGLKMGGSIAGSVAAQYQVAEVPVNGPITREQKGFPKQPMGMVADEIVEQIEQADADDNVDALIIRLNTPGGEVVPSDDIARAVADFDGPTFAYATDVCASGGYWIAAECDDIWARDVSIVGSIGVLGSQFNLTDLADKLGVSYERFVAGDFKDAGNAFKEIEDVEREYIQERVDGFYDQFVDRVAEGRDLDPAAIRDTEAKVYLGEEAVDIDLVDELGAREDVEDAVADRLGLEEVTVREFRPERGLTDRIQFGASAIAYGVGAGVARVLVDEDGPRFR